jgi:hypothetical protein
MEKRAHIVGIVCTTSYDNMMQDWLCVIVVINYKNKTRLSLISTQINNSKSQLWELTVFQVQ